MTKFYVALVEAGVPKFSSAPVAHLDRQAARDEAQRLADAHPGETFELFRDCSVGKTTYRTEPKPVVTEFTGRELIAAAPAGSYRLKDGSFASYGFRVLITDGNRCVLFIDGSDIEALSPDAWARDVFVEV